MNNASIYSNLTEKQRHFLSELLTRLVYEKNLKPGDLAIDVGANHGGHTKPMAAIVGDEGRVFAFEPNPVLIADLEGIGENVSVINVALSNQDDEKRFFIPAGMDGRSSLNRQLVPATAVVEEIKVPTTSLDAFMRAQDGENFARTVRFVKIDCEGEEMNVLSGASDFLRDHRPVIVIENNNAEIVSLMAEAEYKAYDFFGEPFADSPRILSNSVFLHAEVPVSSAILGYGAFERVFLAYAAKTKNLEWHAPKP